MTIKRKYGELLGSKSKFTVCLEVQVKQDEMLTPTEVATYLKVPIHTVWRWCRQGTLPAVKIGKYWRVSRAKLDAYIEESVVKRGRTHG